jgi:hypothetical protein
MRRRGVNARPRTAATHSTSSARPFATRPTPSPTVSSARWACARAYVCVRDACVRVRAVCVRACVCACVRACMRRRRLSPLSRCYTPAAPPLHSLSPTRHYALSPVRRLRHRTRACVCACASVVPRLWLLPSLQRLVPHTNRLCVQGVRHLRSLCWPCQRRTAQLRAMVQRRPMRQGGRRLRWMCLLWHSTAPATNPLAAAAAAATRTAAAAATMVATAAAAAAATSAATHRRRQRLHHRKWLRERCAQLRPHH